MSGRRELVTRYGHNPILTKHDVPYVVETVHNAAVIKASHRYVMLFRSHLRSADQFWAQRRAMTGSGSRYDRSPS